MSMRKSSWLVVKAKVAELEKLIFRQYEICFKAEIFKHQIILDKVINPRNDWL